MTFFSEVREALQRYVNNAGFLVSSEHMRDVMVEARTRLEQLDYLVEQIRKLEELDMSLNSADQMPMLVRLHAETFYYVAARLGSVLRHRKNKAFGLGDYSCEKVSLIRSLIIEHPEGDKGTPTVAFSWQHRDGRGPVLTGLQTSEVTPVQDPGLLRNAEEMRRQLLGAIARAVERITKEKG
jgi:hypothetical protein